MQQLLHEYHCNQQASQDTCWSSYVVPLRNIMGVLAWTKRQYFGVNLNDVALNNFIRMRYEWLNKQKRVGFFEAVRCTQLNKFIFSRLKPDFRTRLETAMKSLDVELASVHGDFHKGNIFINDRRLFLIDWGNYRKKFWGGYDLFHFIFCNFVEQYAGSWGNYIFMFSEKMLTENTELPFLKNKTNMLCYTLARCELEISQDIRLNRLKRRRIQKYQHILEQLSSLL